MGATPPPPFQVAKSIETSDKDHIRSPTNHDLILFNIVSNMVRWKYRYNYWGCGSVCWSLINTSSTHPSGTMIAYVNSEKIATICSCSSHLYEIYEEETPSHLWGPVTQIYQNILSLRRTKDQMNFAKYSLCLIPFILRLPKCLFGQKFAPFYFSLKQYLNSLSRI